MTQGNDGYSEALIGEKEVKLLVPSRRKDGALIDPEKRAAFEGEARIVLEKAFGGCTPRWIIGSFRHDDDRVTREDIVVLSSAVKAIDLTPAIKETIFTFAGAMAAELGQESVFVGWGDESYVISQHFDPADVPVIPFGTLTSGEQARHLTMGWGGLKAPEKILQVLSLDTWTLPPNHTPSRHPLLGLCCVLAEDSGPRRAWHWQGSFKELQTCLAKLRGPDGVNSGDIICLRPKDDSATSISIALVTPKAIVGPRDLRCSEGRLNPVTRQILERVLLRQWDRLANDLKQREPGSAFLRALRDLQQQIQQSVKKHFAQEEDAFRHAVLVVGRMIFLRFLCQKKWSGTSYDTLVSPFAQLGDRYFDDFIRPLWFEVLNVPENQRSDEVKLRFPHYPYLNGGLFLPRPKEREISLPTNVFDPEAKGSFLNLFKDYEFSLNEYAGSDDSLRVDPSLFGKVLETFNSHDEKKQQGVHYTPKPIAWAMAMEAILQRLSIVTDIGRPRLDAMVNGNRHDISGDDARRISTALGQLRIVDPAVGSGVLLWACLEAMLTIDSLCDGLRRASPGYGRGSHMWGERSRHFVCHCLFGVDKSDEAVELTRLRLWLAVALSQDQPSPLPDLEMNICSGDSLATAALPKGAIPGEAAKSRQAALPFDESTRLKNQYAEAAHRYADAGATDTSVQRKLRELMLELRRQMAAVGAEIPAEKIPFDWDLFFPQIFGDQHKRGFDIVIANPPYVRVKSLKSSVGDEGVARYEAIWDTLKNGTTDLYYAFIELALTKLAAPDGGQIAFIQPNFRQTDSAQQLRKLLTGQIPQHPVNLRLWVDFDEQQIFPTASNYVALLFAERCHSEATADEFAYSTPLPKSWTDQDSIDWLRPPGLTGRHPAADEWLTIPPARLKRVLDARALSAATLADFAYVEVGVQTSADGVFLFEEHREKSSQILEVKTGATKRWTPLERALLHPCKKGAAGADYRLLMPYDADGKLLSDAVLAKRYPLAWKYLQSRRGLLEKRDSGKFKGDHWYRFGREQGIRVVSRPKLIVAAALKDAVNPIIDRTGTVALTASGKGGGGAWAISPRNDAVTLDDLAAMLASESAWDHIVAYGSPQKGGWRGVDSKVLLGIPVSP